MNLESTKFFVTKRKKSEIKKTREEEREREHDKGRSEKIDRKYQREIWSGVHTERENIKNS